MRPLRPLTALKHLAACPRGGTLPPAVPSPRRRWLWSGLAAAVLGALPMVVLARAPSPLARAQDGCAVRAAKHASAATVSLGAPVQLTLTVQADCSHSQAPLRLVVVADNSVDMGGLRMDGLKRAVAGLPDLVDLSRSEIGVIAFHAQAEILTGLTRDPVAIAEASRRFFPRQGHNLVMGVRAGRQMIEQARQQPGAPAATDVLVVWVAGPADQADDVVLAEAKAAKDAGILVATVGANGLANFTLLEAMASVPALFFAETLGDRFPSLMREIVTNLTVVHLTGAQVTDSLPDALGYVWGSGVPAPRVRGNDLAWRYAVWPAGGLTITYQVTCGAIGRHAAHVSAAVELQFDRGAPQTYAFAAPEIACVTPPTVTPTPSVTPAPSATATATPPATATATATASPTPPAAAYLPALWKSHCVPTRHADVAMVLDTSSSMLATGAAGEVKLQLALDAASAFVDALDLPADRAAVVAVSSRSDVLQPLSGDRLSLQLALARLFHHVRYGSRLERGLDVARGLLGAPDRPAASVPVIVVLTDGLTGDPAAARRAAAAARDAGITLYAVGLGETVDEAVLRDMAGAPSRYFHSPDGADLRGIYLDIARMAGCAAP